MNDYGWCCNIDKADGLDNVDEITLYCRKDSSYATYDRHYELIGLPRPITMRYLCPPFTPSFLAATPIQPNRHLPGVPSAELLLLPFLY